MRWHVVAILIVFLAGCTKGERDSSAKVDAAAAPATSTMTTASAAASSASEMPFALPVVAPATPTTPPRIDPPSPASEWVWKPYRGDHFTVLFPGEPKLKELPAEEDRVGYTEASFDVPGGQVSFAAGFSEYPQADVAKPDAFLDEKANTPRRGTTDVLTKRSITLPGGHPGRVLILRRNISGTPLRVYSRLHLVGRRLYSLIVSTLDVGGIGEDVVKKFMESFKPL
jgi:hypothetical protein